MTQSIYLFIHPSKHIMIFMNTFLHQSSVYQSIHPFPASTVSVLPGLVSTVSWRCCARGSLCVCLGMVVEQLLFQSWNQAPDALHCSSQLRSPLQSPLQWCSRVLPGPAPSQFLHPSLPPPGPLCLSRPGVSWALPRRHWSEQTGPWAQNSQSTEERWIAGSDCRHTRPAGILEECPTGVKRVLP